MVQAVGLFGGTFDPVHLGHLRSAVEIAELFDLEHVRLIPNAVPPHRAQPEATAQHRLLMLQLAVKNSPNIIIDDCELQREGPSYSIDTVKLMREQMPDAALYLIVGTDAFQALDSWHEWQDLLTYCHIIVMQRPDQAFQLSETLQPWYQQHLALDADKQRLAGAIWPVTLTQLAISATEIRSKIRDGNSAAYLTPDPVVTIMEQLGLYR